ncbi:hypothetical protein Tco_1254631 [Tanacetum coccineum]
MDDPNITIEEYIRLEEEKARRRGKVYNWETATYGKIWYDEDVHDLRSVETEFPAIVLNDSLTSNETPSCEPTVNSENDNEKVNMPSFPPPEPMVSCLNDLDFFKDFENEFPAIVYNDALTSKSDFSTEHALSPQDINEFDLKNETSLSECDEEEQNVLYFNDVFPFNVIYPDDSKSDKDNDDDKIDIKQSSGDMSVKPLPDLIYTNVGAYAHRFVPRPPMLDKVLTLASWKNNNFAIYYRERRMGFTQSGSERLEFIGSVTGWKDRTNAIDEDVDEQPVQDLALNVDNVFQADDCDAYDSVLISNKRSLISDAFDELEADLDQSIVDRKHDEIKRKNLRISNDNLIADYLSKEVFHVASNSELNVSKLTEMQKAHNVVKARCLELEAELSNLRDNIRKDNYNELLNRLSNLEVNHLNLQLKYQNLKDSFQNKPSSSDNELCFNSVFMIGQNESFTSRKRQPSSKS